MALPVRDGHTRTYNETLRTGGTASAVMALELSAVYTTCPQGQ
jgi:hypothetical protein